MTLSLTETSTSVEMVLHGYQMRLRIFSYASGSLGTQVLRVIDESNQL